MSRTLEVCRQIRLDTSKPKGPTKKCPGGYSIPAEHTCGGKKVEKAGRAQRKSSGPSSPERQNPRRQPGESPGSFLKSKHASPTDSKKRYKPGYPLDSSYTQEVASAFLEENNIPRDRPVPMGQNHALADGKGGYPLLGTEGRDDRGFAEFGQQPVTIENGDFMNIAGGKMRTMIRAIDGPLQTTTSRPGRAGMSFVGIDRRNEQLESEIASKSAPGKLWTTNAFRQSAGWQWMTEPIQTGTVSKSRTSRDPVPAILSVTQNLSGPHYYCLDMDTGTSSGVLTIQPDKKDEPKNLVGGYGHLVLGKPVGVIRGSSGQVHPVFDRIQVSPPLTPDQPLVSISADWGQPRPPIRPMQLSMF